MPESTLKMLDLRGNHFDMGLRYGRECKPQIERLLAVRVGMACQRNPMTPEECFDKASRFRPMFEAHAPSAVQEVEGIAQGAGLSTAEVWFLQAWEEVTGGPRSAGSYVGAGPEASESGGVLIGMNLDASAWSVEHMVLLRREPAGKPAGIQVAHYGELGGCGFNAAGVGGFDGALHGNGFEVSMPVRLLCRLAAESDAAGNCLDALKGASVAGCNMLLGDSNAERIVNVEIFGKNHEITYDGGGLYAHANIVHAPELRQWEQIDDKEADQSRTREVQMLLLADQHRCGVNVDVMKHILSNHESYPHHSICRHNGEDGRPSTVASFVVDMVERRLHACLGPPCKGEFQVVEI